MNSTTTRREFLKTGITLAALPYFVPAHVLGAGGATIPSEKIVLGCIGVGSMGGGHVRGWGAGGRAARAAPTPTGADRAVAGPLARKSHQAAPDR